MTKILYWVVEEATGDVVAQMASGKRALEAWRPGRIILGPMTKAELDQHIFSTAFPHLAKD